MKNGGFAIMKESTNSTRKSRNFLNPDSADESDYRDVLMSALFYFELSKASNFGKLRK